MFTMSLNLCFYSNSPTITPPRSNLYTFPKPHRIKCLDRSQEKAPQNKSKLRLQNILSTAASLYPVYVTAGGALACVKPSAFSWFVHLGPTSYSLSLAFIMLAMGLTLELKDLLGLFKQKPLSVSVVVLPIIISSPSEILQLVALIWTDSVRMCSSVYNHAGFRSNS